VPNQEKLSKKAVSVEVVPAPHAVPVRSSMAKNTAQLHTLFAQSKLWMVRRQLGGVQA